MSEPGKRIADPLSFPETEGWGAMSAPAGGRVECGRVAAEDGESLFYRTWIAGPPRTGDGSAAPLVFLVHGLGGQSGWYIRQANALADRGLSVLIPDLRGFGRSSGERGHVSRGGLLLNDLEGVLRATGQTADASSVHLIGHSMGAALAVHLAVRICFDSITLVNPWVEDAMQVSGIEVASLALGGLMCSKRYWSPPGGVGRMTNNAEAQRYLDRDPYWVRNQTVTFLTRVLWLRSLMPIAARRVETPALVIQCQDDLVLRQGASRRLFERLGSREKQWETPPGSHDYEFEIDLEPVDRLIEGWVKSHSPGGGR